MSTDLEGRKFPKKLGGFLSGNPALAGVAGLGFAVSFQTIAHLAKAHHLPGWPVVYPVLIDVGILSMVIESRKAIEARRIDLAPRVLAWTLIGLTLYVNAHGAASHDWLGRALHVVGPALWAALLELTRWRRIARRKADEKRDGIPAARWLVAPLASAAMHRRMVLRDIKSYRLAVELEDARLFSRDLARAHFGRGWRRRAPRVLALRIRSGRLGDDVTRAVTESAAGGVAGGWEAAVRGMVTSAITEGDKLDLAVKEQQRQIGLQAAATGQDTPSRTGQRPDRTGAAGQDSAPTGQPRPDRTAGGQDSPSRTGHRPDRTGAAGQADGNRAAIRVLLSGDSPPTHEAIAARVGVNPRTVRRVAREMRGESGDGARRPHLAPVPPDPAEAAVT